MIIALNFVRWFNAIAPYVSLNKCPCSMKITVWLKQISTLINSGWGFVKSTDIETTISQHIDFYNNRIQNQCIHKHYVSTYIYLLIKTQIGSEETIPLMVMYYICAVIQHSRSPPMKWQTLCGSCKRLEQMTSDN